MFAAARALLGRCHPAGSFHQVARRRIGHEKRFTANPKPLVSFLFDLKRDLKKLEHKGTVSGLKILLEKTVAAASTGQLVDLGSIQRLHVLACEYGQWEDAQSLIELPRQFGMTPTQSMMLRQWQACIAQGHPELAHPWVQKLLQMHCSLPNLHGDRVMFGLAALQLQRLLGAWLHSLQGQLHGQEVSEAGDSALLLAVDGFLMCSLHATCAVLQCMRSADTAMAAHERLQAAGSGPPALLGRDACLQAFTDAAAEKSVIGDGLSDILEVQQDGLPLLPAAAAASAEAAAAAEEQAAALLQALQVAGMDQDDDSSEEEESMGGFSAAESEELKSWRELHFCATAAARRCSLVQGSAAAGEALEDDQHEVDVEGMDLPENAVGRLMVQEVLRVNAVALQHWRAGAPYTERGRLQPTALGAAMHLHPTAIPCVARLPATPAQSGAVPLPAARPVFVRDTASATHGSAPHIRGVVRLAPLTRRSLVRSFLDSVKRVASSELDAVEAGMPHARRRSLQRSIARVAKRDSALLEDIVLRMCAECVSPPPLPVGAPYGAACTQHCRAATAKQASPPLHLRNKGSWLLGSSAGLTARAAAAVRGLSGVVQAAPAAMEHGTAQDEPASRAEDMWSKLQEHTASSLPENDAGNVKLDAQDVLSLLAVPPSHLPGRAAVDTLTTLLLNEGAIRQAVREFASPGRGKVVCIGLSGDAAQDSPGHPVEEHTVHLAGSGALDAPLQVRVRQQLETPIYDFHASRVTALDWCALHTFWPAVCVPRGQVTAAASRLMSLNAGLTLPESKEVDT